MGEMFPCHRRVCKRGIERLRDERQMLDERPSSGAVLMAKRNGFRMMQSGSCSEPLHSS
jgi:hypothetical protein